MKLIDKLKIKIKLTKEQLETAAEVGSNWGLEKRSSGRRKLNKHLKALIVFIGMLALVIVTGVAR